VLAQAYNGKISRKNEKLFRENNMTTIKSKNSKNGVQGYIHHCDKKKHYSGLKL
jgi:ribosomal protein S17E